ESLIDYHSVYSPHRRRARYEFTEEHEGPGVHKLKAQKGYMDRFINPPEFMDAQRKKIEDQLQKKKRFPEEPTKDILEFLIEYAPLDTWQRDILSIVREEAYYFAPQALTKIMNEKSLKEGEVIDFADHHSATLGMRPGAINPYKLGVELWRSIEERWDKGQFGRE